MMATAPARKQRQSPRKGLVTVDEYMAMPDDGNRYELIHGELVMSPSGRFDHGAAVIVVAAKVRDFVYKRKLGWVTVETDVIMGKHLVLRPDISFVSNKQASIIKGHMYGPPDLAIEITSPSNRQMDVFAKRHEYERFGIREYWALDIAERRFQAYQWYLHNNEYRGGLLRSDSIKSRVLKGFVLKLDEVWEAAMP